ncbi:MAG TPA: glycosylase [Verrucomicrobiae bacterium]|nr:glycosylase [Verrucomicrobiae bacterium]
METLSCSRERNLLVNTALLLMLLASGTSNAAETNGVSPVEMQAIYEEVRTPCKYGVVLEPPPGKKVDCPNVFRAGDRWYMMYVLLENSPEGYTTQLAESTNLLHWQPLGTILNRGGTNTWDHANAGGGVALFDTKWGGSNTLLQYEGQYWLSYLGGELFGYEKTPLAIGLGYTSDPSRPEPWRKLPKPVLRADDADARPQEKETLYKSYIFRDEHRTLGAPFVMFYNAKPNRGSEQIFAATSHDMKTWKRFGSGTALENLPPAGARHGVISGDPQVVRMNDLWVMFYFGAFWKEGAFDTFAASRDLVNWTKWDGEDLVKPSEPFDTPFAHKPWLIKHDGVVYHFYCAVGGKNHHRTIALATSRDLRPKP